MLRGMEHVQGGAQLTTLTGGNLPFSRLQVWWLRLLRDPLGGLHRFVRRRTSSAQVVT